MVARPIIIDEAGSPVRLRRHALARRQLADKLKIPYAYFERMRDGATGVCSTATSTPGCKARTTGACCARWTARCARCCRTATAAWTTSTWPRACCPSCSSCPTVRFESVELTETKMYLKCITPRLSYEMAPGDVVQAGVVISNSEVGQGTLSVQPLLYPAGVQQRLDRVRPLAAQDARGPRARHRGRGGLQVYQDDTLRADDKAFFLKVRDVVQAAVSEATFRQTAQKMQKTLNPPHRRPGEDGRGAGPALHAQRRERSGVLRHLITKASSVGLRAGQCGDALQPGDRRL
jgi:hypothetical protein